MAQRGELRFPALLLAAAAGQVHAAAGVEQDQERAGPRGADGRNERGTQQRGDGQEDHRHAQGRERHFSPRRERSELRLDGEQRQQGERDQPHGEVAVENGFKTDL